MNKVLISDIYPLPMYTTEDLFASLAGANLFCKLDLTNAYRQLAVSEEDARYTTSICIMVCLFTYNHLPFVTSSAPAVFHTGQKHAFSLPWESIGCILEMH